MAGAFPVYCTQQLGLVTGVRPSGNDAILRVLTLDTSVRWDVLGASADAKEDESVLGGCGEEVRQHKSMRPGSLAQDQGTGKTW